MRQGSFLKIPSTFLNRYKYLSKKKKQKSESTKQIVNISKKEKTEKIIAQKRENDQSPTNKVNVIFANEYEKFFKFLKTSVIQR